MPRKTGLPVAGDRGVRIRLPPPAGLSWCEAFTAPFSRLVLTRNRGFESISLQRRVSSEPDFLEERPSASRWAVPKKLRPCYGDRGFESRFLQQRVSLSAASVFEGREPRLSARVCAA